VPPSPPAPSPLLSKASECAPLAHTNGIVVDNSMGNLHPYVVWRGAAGLGWVGAHWQDIDRMRGQLESDFTMLGPGVDGSWGSVLPDPAEAARVAHCRNVAARRGLWRGGGQEGSERSRDKGIREGRRFKGCCGVTEGTTQPRMFQLCTFETLARQSGRAHVHAKVV